MTFLLHLLQLTLLSALAGAAWVAHRPAELGPVANGSAGTEAKVETSKAPRERDLIDELKQAAIKSAGLVEFSEADLNRHVSKVLTANTSAIARGIATFERLAIDLETELARLTLEWRIYGQRRTATVDLRVSREANAFRIEIVGGRYGHLEVPRGLLRPLLPALSGLVRALEPEIDALFQMNHVRFAQDKLVFDPRFP